MGNRLIYSFFGVFVGFAVLYNLTCAKRDNPFDPINFRETAAVCPAESLAVFKTNVSLELSAADRAVLAVQASSGAMRSDSSAIYSIFSANGVIETSNRAKRDQNRIIDSINLISTIVDSLRFKLLLDTLAPIAINPSYRDTLSAKSQQIETVQLKIRTLIAGFESSCSGNKTALQSFEDSATTVVKNDSMFTGAVAAQSASLVRTSNDSALAIAGYNAAIIGEDTGIASYNENIAWRIRTKSVTHISSPDSLISNIARAVPGDTFIIDGEITTRDLIHFDTSGTAQRPIVLMGTPGMTSIIDATGGIIITNRRYISLVNLTIRNSGASGFKVENGAGSIEIDHCVIRDNVLYGVEAIDSDLHINRTKIMHNGKSGLRFAPTTSNTITLDNVLVVKNHGHGIEIVSPSGYMNLVTVSNNDSSGIDIPTFSLPFTITKSLITYNGDFGVKATILPGNAYLILLESDNFFGNRTGDIDTVGHYSYTTFEPGYRDTANDDFSIVPNGPLQGNDIGYNENK